MVQNQDSTDCTQLKTDLSKITSNNFPGLQYLVRIACRELENRYLGDLITVEQIYPETKASKKKNKAKFRNPDKLNGSEEPGKLTNEFMKIYCAKKIGPIIDIANNKSTSFKHFINGLNKLLH